MVIMEIKPVGLTWSFWSCQIPLLEQCGRRATVGKEKPDWFAFFAHTRRLSRWLRGGHAAFLPVWWLGGTSEEGAPRVKMAPSARRGPRGSCRCSAIPAFVSPKVLEGHGGKKQLHLQRQDHGDTVGLALKWARGWEQCTKMDRGWVEPRAVFYTAATLHKALFISCLT